MVDNRIKTFLLLAILTAVALGIGRLFGTTGLIIAIVLVLVMNVASYFYSDKIALKMYKATEVSAKEQPELHKLVFEVAQLAKIPKPRVYIIPSNTFNAFATGRNPKNSAVAFTAGIMQLLSKEELKGVIAHEIAHIKNRDILITTVASMVAGVISYVASMAQWGAIFGGLGGQDDGPGMVEFLVMIILAPILAMILRMSLSRTREYLADKTGAEFLRNGNGLANALLKLEKGVQVRPLKFGPEGGEGMFIVNPFRGKAFVNLFSTHPSTESRIKKLRQLRFT